MKTFITAMLLVTINLVGVEVLVRHYALGQQDAIRSITDRMDSFQTEEAHAEREALDKAVRQSGALLLGQAEGMERQAQLIKKLDAVLGKLSAHPRKPPPPPKKPWWRLFW